MHTNLAVSAMHFALLAVVPLAVVPLHRTGCNSTAARSCHLENTIIVFEQPSPQVLVTSVKSGTIASSRALLQIAATTALTCTVMVKGPLNQLEVWDFEAFRTPCHNNEIEMPGVSPGRNTLLIAISALMKGCFGAVVDKYAFKTPQLVAASILVSV